MCVSAHRTTANARPQRFVLHHKNRYRKLAEQWGKILATGHARADNDFDEGLVPFSLEEHVTEATKDSVEQFQKLVRDIAFPYATQVNEDWENWKPADDGSGEAGITLAL